MIPPVRKQVRVPVLPDRAFAIFWQEMGMWWPLDSHAVAPSRGARAVALRFEPGVGGRITEVTDAGDEIPWGRVTEWSPGAALAFSWHLDRPEAEATLVRVTFTADGTGTRVALEHGGWAARGDGAEARGNYDSGWDRVFVGGYGARAGHRGSI